MREKLRRLVAHPAWELAIGLFTLSAVFGFPAYTLVCPDGLRRPAFVAAVVLLFVVFVADCAMRVAAFGASYARSFYFAIDALAALSIVAELPGGFTAADAGAWPNPRVLRMSVYVTRLARLARQSRTVIRLRDLLFRRKLGHSASAAEHHATELQQALEARFSTLVALFVVLGLLLIPLREAITERHDLHQALRRVEGCQDPSLRAAQRAVLRADPRVLSLSDGPADVAAVAASSGLAEYEVGLFREGSLTMVVSHREERRAGARLDIFLALFIVLVMATMSAAFSRATDRVLIAPLRDLQRAVEDAIGRNDALGFLRTVEESEPVTFLKRVFIPLLERLVAAVNVEARESILGDGGPSVRSRDWAIAITDIQGFTTLMETLGPAGFTAINEYFRHCAAIVAEHGGDIFEHTGDGFIVTVDGPGKEGRAFDMAVKIVEELDRITGTEAWRGLLDHPAWERVRRIRTRIGVHCGTVITGRIGTERICRYGLIGEAANIAARLESANKQFGTWILVTEAIARAAPPALAPRTRRIDRVIVVGTSQPVELYTYDLGAGDAYPQFRGAFDAGVERYLAGDWPKAKEHLARAHELWPEDGAATALLARIEGLGPTAPADFAGAFKLAQK